MALRALILLPLVLAGCGPDSASPSAVAGGADGTPSVAPDASMIREVSTERTLGLVSEGLLQASPSAAIQTIDLWVTRLDTVSADGVPDLRDDLTTLRNLLQSSPLDGPAIGRVLQSLGDRTIALAEDGTSLSALGVSLRTQGNRLAPDTSRVERNADSAR